MSYDHHGISQANWLFVQQLIPAGLFKVIHQISRSHGQHQRRSAWQANIKDNIKVLHYCPFMKESTGDWWIPLTKS